MLKNIAAILEAAGSSLAHVVRCGVFLVDMGEFQKMNAVYARASARIALRGPPSRSRGFRAPGLRVEIDAIAVIPRE